MFCKGDQTKFTLVTLNAQIVNIIGMCCGGVKHGDGMWQGGEWDERSGDFVCWRGLLWVLAPPHHISSSPSSPLYQRSVMENVGDIRSGAQQWWILVGWAVLVLGWEARGYCSLRERKGVMDLVLWNRDCGCTGSGE